MGSAKMQSVKTAVIFLSLKCVLTSSLPSEPRFVFTEIVGGGEYSTGDSVLLQVTVRKDHLGENSDWKFCKWTRQVDGAFCQFNYRCEGMFCSSGVGNFYIHSICSPQLSDRAKFSGEDPNVHNRVCGIWLSDVTNEDSSRWTVEVEECKAVGCGWDNGNDIVISSTLTVVVQ